MPITMTFDIEGANPTNYREIQSMFERLGWENLGGSAYRYPKLGSTPYTEDWFNHVIPALMIFRSYAIKSGNKINKLTLDTNSSTGYLPEDKYGTCPKKSDDIKLYEPRSKQFGEKNLKEFLDSFVYPYDTESTSA